jgi:hypothetical protein
MVDLLQPEGPTSAEIALGDHQAGFCQRPYTALALAVAQRGLLRFDKRVCARNRDHPAGSRAGHTLVRGRFAMKNRTLETNAKG